MGEPNLERIETADGDVVYCWIADQPAFGVAFRVLEEEWNEDYTVRTIKRIEIVGS